MCCSASSSASPSLLLWGLFWDPSAESPLIYPVSSLLMLCGKQGKTALCFHSKPELHHAEYWMTTEKKKKSPFCQLNLMSAKHLKKKKKYCLLCGVKLPNWLILSERHSAYRNVRNVCVCFFCILFSKLLLIVRVCVNKAFTFIINHLLFLPSFPALFFSYCFNPLLVAIITQWDLPEKFQEKKKNTFLHVFIEV